MRASELAIPFGSHDRGAVPGVSVASLFAREWLPDTRPIGVVCLVHGIGEHSGRYQHVAERITATGLAVLAVDLPGHGRTDGPRGHSTFPQLLDAVDALLGAATALWPGVPLIPYGHSLGGTIVLNHALRRKPSVTAVVATSPLLLTASPQPAWKTVAARIGARVWPTLTIANGLELSALSRQPSAVAAYAADPLVHDRVSTALGDGMLKAGRWALAHAAEFPVPLLLVHGTGDRLTDHDATRRFAAAAGASVCTLRLWDGLYHETHNEAEWAEVVDYSIDWIGQRLSRG